MLGTDSGSLLAAERGSQPAWEVLAKFCSPDIARQIEYCAGTVDASVRATPHPRHWQALAELVGIDSVEQGTNQPANANWIKS